MDNILTKDTILIAEDIVIKPVEVPEWKVDGKPGVVHIKGLTGAQKDHFESTLTEGRGKNRTENWKNFRARLLVLTIVDKDGKRLFGLDDVEALGKKSASALDRLFTVAQELSGFRDEDVEALTKNLKATPEGDSSLD